MISISIIVPVYNVERYLNACVDSIIAQTDPNFELLLIDDGSTDTSGQICDVYAQRDQRIQVIHQKNAGLGGARNTGIEAASGDFLLFVDSDDMLNPCTVELLRLQQKKMQTDLLIFMFESVDESGKHLQYFRDNVPLNNILSLKYNPAENKSLLLNAPVAWNRLYRKSLFWDTGIRFPGRVWYEDIRTTLKLMLHAEKIAYLNESLYQYRMREGSITKNINAERNREIIDAFIDIFSYFKQEGKDEQFTDELCFLTIDHVYIAASVRVIRIDPSHPLISEFADFLRTNFPDYMQNPYLQTLSRNKKIVLWLLERRMHRTLRLIFKWKG